MKKSKELKVVAPHDWRTTDEDEINRRRLRAQTEAMKVTNTDARHPIFSNFRVASPSGMTYLVEIRGLRSRQFACTCVDFRINGLGTCKHVEAVLGQLEARHKRLYREAQAGTSNRVEILPDRENDSLRMQCASGPVPRALKKWFAPNGRFQNGEVEEAVNEIRELAKTALPQLRLSQELEPWLEHRRRAAERRELRREYEFKVQRGVWPAHETKVPLFPYQREGMLHLAFTERALLADEMGLGKTIQAIAACALLHRLGQARRVLVVTPASLKTEWEEQIQKFTGLPYQLVFGNLRKRLGAYETAPFFTIVNYEQMLTDALEVNQRLQPDIVVLDEAQRIKNWSTKTTQAIKRLRSRYAFVLTGTPIENRIDELHSLMDFLDPSLLGPLFRFNREYYELDERGRPAGYRNLGQLRERVKPLVLRRRKAEVETELPARTERCHFVPLANEQQMDYEGFAGVVTRLVHLSKRRPLTKEEQDRLLRYLGMMRMVCDTPYILNPESRVCPKLGELEKILEECRDNPEVKVIIFSEWERMLELVRELCDGMDLGHAWHTGSVPQRRRRAEINTFKADPNCRVFLSTDSGATGLNLQVASVVINCDLPWNPAKLEQRIARAWRKNQTRPVTVINLVSENTIEHQMLSTLSQKRALSDGVLDGLGDLAEIKMRGGRQAFLSRLEQLMAPGVPSATPKPPTAPARPPLPADRPLGFAKAAREIINGALVHCEERFPREGAHSVLYVVVDRDAPLWRERLTGLHTEYFGPGVGDPAAPVRLEVIDRATDEALQRLIDAGLVTRTARASRPLEAAAEENAGPPPLSEAERQKATELRQQAGRKLKMAKVLAQNELESESRQAMLEAVLPLARALAVEHRLTEPTDAGESLLQPFAWCWKEALPPLREFMADVNRPLQGVLEALARV